MTVHETFFTHLNERIKAAPEVSITYHVSFIYTIFFHSIRISHCSAKLSPREKDGIQSLRVRLSKILSLLDALIIDTSYFL